jgi:hypothetical protein
VEVEVKHCVLKALVDKAGWKIFAINNNCKLSKFISASIAYLSSKTTPFVLAAKQSQPALSAKAFFIL